MDRLHSHILCGQTDRIRIVYFIAHWSSSKKNRQEVFRASVTTILLNPVRLDSKKKSGYYARRYVSCGVWLIVSYENLWMFIMHPTPPNFKVARNLVGTEKHYYTPILLVWCHSVMMITIYNHPGRSYILNISYCHATARALKSNYIIWCLFMYNVLSFNQGENNIIS